MKKRNVFIFSLLFNSYSLAIALSSLDDQTTHAVSPKKVIATKPNPFDEQRIRVISYSL